MTHPFGAELSPVELACIAYECSTCGAVKDEWCVVVSAPNRKAAQLHAARFWRAHDDGALPIPEENTP